MAAQGLESRWAYLERDLKQRLSILESIKLVSNMIRIKESERRNELIANLFFRSKLFAVVLHMWVENSITLFLRFKLHVAIV